MGQQAADQDHQEAAAHLGGDVARVGPAHAPAGHFAPERAEPGGEDGQEIVGHRYQEDFGLMADVDGVVVGGDDRAGQEDGERPDREGKVRRCGVQPGDAQRQHATTGQGTAHGRLRRDPL